MKKRRDWAEMVASLPGFWPINHSAVRRPKMSRADLPNAWFSAAEPRTPVMPGRFGRDGPFFRFVRSAVLTFRGALSGARSGGRTSETRMSGTQVSIVAVWVDWASVL